MPIPGPIPHGIKHLVLRIATPRLILLMGTRFLLSTRKKRPQKKSNRRIMESRIGGLAIGLIMKNSGMAPSPRSSTKTSSLSFLTPRARKPYWHPIQCSLVSCLKEDKHESGRSDRSGQRVDRVAREVQLRIDRKS